MKTLIAGDIGGTHTRLAVFSWENPHVPLFLENYRSAEHSSFEAILAIFLGRMAEVHPQLRPVAAGLGVAGPVKGIVVRLTNLPWQINQEETARALGLKQVVFLNDFAALCHAIPHLEESHLRGLGQGDAVPQGVKAVVGAGTGLGQGFLVWRGGRYQVVASEGGNGDFAPRTLAEMKLWAYLREKHGRVSVERVVSGGGLVNIYDFLRDVEGLTLQPGTPAPEQSSDPARAISKGAMESKDPLCIRALEMMISAYGASAGNLALQVLATGGMYVAGGISPQILPLLEQGGFQSAFQDKGRYTEFLKGIPLWVITHSHPGLTGAAIAARESVERSSF